MLLVLQASRTPESQTNKSTPIRTSSLRVEITLIRGNPTVDPICKPTGADWTVVRDNNLGALPDPFPQSRLSFVKRRMRHRHSLVQFPFNSRLP